MRLLRCTERRPAAAGGGRPARAGRERRRARAEDRAANGEQNARRRGRAARIRAAFLLALAPLASSCAGLATERHVAPIYTEISVAGGGTRIEGLGGAVMLHRPAPDSPFDQWGLRPIFIHDRYNAHVSDTDFLEPLGAIRWRPGRYMWRFIPLVRYQRYEHADGTRQWTFLTMLGVYISRYPDGRVVRAWFPFAGVLEGVLSYDRLVFVLWPLFMQTERNDVTTYHVIWPFFSWAEGEGAKTWKVWPIVGRNAREGVRDRWFFLWPFFHYHRDNIKAGPELETRKWMVFPLVGRATVGDFRSTSVLWPFFGYSHDEGSGFWAIDAPWFLVRIQRPGTSGTAKVTRLRPAYSRFEDQGLVSTWYVWPVANHRFETYPDGTRDALHVIPFWHGYTRSYDSGREFRYEKLWPLYKRERLDGLQQLAFPALLPFWRTPRVDRMYAWLWELYTVQHGEGVSRHRSWLGLWRREHDGDEDRKYVTGLWSNRKYRLAGEDVSETSICFGLLRWRTGPDGLEGLLPPAFPGPGWPLERMPRTADLGSGPVPVAPVGEEWIDFQ